MFRNIKNSILLLISLFSILKASDNSNISITTKFEEKTNYQEKFKEYMKLGYITEQANQYKCNACNHNTKITPSARKNIAVHVMRKHTHETNFQCGLCDYKCATPDVLSSHIKKHNSEKEYKCPKCKFETHHKNSLELHLINMHNFEEKKFKCNYCNQKFTLKTKLKQHMAEKHEPENKAFKCTLCDKTFAKNSNLKAHIKKEHQTNYYKCLFCHYEFDKKLKLQNHVKQEHMQNNQENYLNIVDHADLNELAQVILSIRPDNQAINHKDIEDVNLNNSETQISKTTEPLAKNSNNDATETQPNISYQDIEPVITHSSNDIQENESTKLYKCDYCDYTSKLMPNLNRHILNIHTSIKLFNCIYCDYATSDESAFKKHMIKQHNLLKSFFCIYCGECFPSSSKLNKHANIIHVNELNQINNKDIINNDTLIFACNTNNIELVKIALNNNCDINWTDEFKNTALMHACLNQNEEIVKLLIEAGADLNLRNNNGNRAIDIAIEQNSEEIIKILWMNI